MGLLDWLREIFRDDSSDADAPPEHAAVEPVITGVSDEVAGSDSGEAAPECHDDSASEAHEEPSPEFHEEPPPEVYEEPPSETHEELHPEAHEELTAEPHEEPPTEAQGEPIPESLGVQPTESIETPGEEPQPPVEEPQPAGEEARESDQPAAKSPEPADEFTAAVAIDEPRADEDGSQGFDAVAARQEHAASQILDDERLRGDLTDDEYEPLLDWAIATTDRVAAETQSEPDQAADQQLEATVSDVRRLVDAVAWAVGNRYDISPERFADELQSVGDSLGAPILPDTIVESARQRWHDMTEHLASMKDDMDGAELTRALITALTPDSATEQS